MTETIWKFPILVCDEQEIEMPQFSQVLTVQMQDGQPCLWAFVDPERPMRKRKIRVFGTGHTIESCGRYISTFQMQGGALVFHVFEG